MKKLFTVFLLTVLVSGCGFIEYRAMAGSKGASASDATLHDALWIICNAVPVGAIKRRFNTIEKLVQYNSICEDQSKIQI